MAVGSRIVSIIQARTGSTRLPRKVLHDLAGEPLLARVVERVARTPSIDAVVVATTTEPGDDEIEKLCEARSWACYRGSSQDLLDRYYQAAIWSKADIVMRVCSDSPLVDPEIQDRLARQFLERQPNVDYMSTILDHRTYPLGLDGEVFRIDVLERAWREDRDPAYREHATPYIYRHPEIFRLEGMFSDVDYSGYRLTVDTPEDYEVLRRIYDHFGHDRFSWREAISLLEANPEWHAINRHIRQKTV